MFETHNVFTKREQEARHEIQVEMYTKKIQIESRIIADMANTYIIPSALRYQNVLIENVKGIKEIFASRHELANVGIKDKGLSDAFSEGSGSDSLVDTQMGMIKEVSERVSIIKNNVELMVEERKKANQIEHATEKAFAYCEKVKPYFDEIRYHSDKLEILIDDSMWPFPKYRELLFVK